MHKIGQSEGFLGRLLEPLLKTELALMKKVFKPLARIFLIPLTVLIPLGLTAVASVTDAAIHKKMFVCGNTTIISNEEINDIMKTIQSYEESSLSIKCVSETIKKESREQKVGFLSMLLGTFGASLLGNLVTGKGTIRAGEGTIRAGQDF